MVVLILANEERIARASLQTAIDAEKDPAKKADLQRQLGRVEPEFAGRRTQLERQTDDPLQSYGRRLIDATENMDEAFKGVKAEGLQQLEDGLVGVISGTESVAGAFKKMAAAIIADLARIAIQKAIVGVIGKSFFGFADGGLVGIEGHAAGGFISGPGSGTSDDILSWLSNGEFVVTAAATKRHLPLLRAMNDNSLPAFATGGIVGSWATKRDPFAADTNLWRFYKNEQANAKLIVLDLWMEGTANVTAGEAFERSLKSYGGVFPAGPIRLKSGTLPGVTLVNGRLSGQLAAGEYPVVFGITDASGREVTLPVTFKAAAQTGYRYFRFTPKKAGPGFYSPTPDEGGYRIGCREIRPKAANGSVMNTAGWTAASLSSSGDHPPSALLDGSAATEFLTDGGLQPKPGVIILDSSSGAGVKPSSFDIGDSVTDESYQIDGVVIEASRNGAAYVKIGEMGAGRGYAAFPNEPQGPRMVVSVA